MHDEFERLTDISGRVQVVSNNPTPEALDQPDVVRAVNDELAGGIATFPDRFRGFCFLPMAYPQLASDELERYISQLGFVGALVDSHLLNNTFYDGPDFDPLWATFERLDVPIYLHPTYPRTEEVNGIGGLYTPDNGVYPVPVASVLGTAGWGWHSDTGVSFLRLWLAGVFDRHPGLKIVLGHMGEMLPYMLARANEILGAAKPAGFTVPEAYAKNVWVTTSGFFSLDPFSTVLRTTGMDRIMVRLLVMLFRLSGGVKLTRHRSSTRLTIPGRRMRMARSSWKRSGSQGWSVRKCGRALRSETRRSFSR